jgi:hypothetical protein
MNESTVALERKAIRSRSRLAGLVDDLQSQLLPGKMIDQALGFTKGETSDLSKTIIRQIGKNPLPFLLIAGGIGWLLLSEFAGENLTKQRQSKSRKKSSKIRAAR